MDGSGAQLSPHPWPQVAQRRGAWAAAILSIVLIPVMFDAWPIALAASGSAFPWISVALYLMVIPLSCVVLPLLGPGALRRALASRATPRAMAAGLALGLCIALACLGLERAAPDWFAIGSGALAAPREEVRGYGVWLFFGVMTMVLVGPAMEEWLYRGVLWSALTRVLGPLATISVTAAVFTVDHGPGRVRDFPILFVCGALLGVLRHRTGSLAPGLLAHSLWNLGAVYTPMLSKALG